MECDSDNLVCAQVNGNAHYYGDILLQLDLVIDQMAVPINMHSDCPNPERNTITKTTCGWQTMYAEQYCKDSISKGML